MSAQRAGESVFRAVLDAAADNFARRCVEGLAATERGPALVEQGLMLATALAPVLGYDEAARLAKEALRSGRTIRCSMWISVPVLTARSISPAVVFRPSDSRTAPDARTESQPIAASTPLRRVTTPEEFADAALFFAGPWARAVTGQNLVVDGGLVKNG